MKFLSFEFEILITSVLFIILALMSLGIAIFTSEDSLYWMNRFIGFLTFAIFGLCLRTRMCYQKKIALLSCKASYVIGLILFALSTALAYLVIYKAPIVGFGIIISENMLLGYIGISLLWIVIVLFIKK